MPLEAGQEEVGQVAPGGGGHYSETGVVMIRSGHSCLSQRL